MQAASSFGMRNFGDLDLGDKRRTRRLVKSVDFLCRHPGGTLPQKFARPADLKAFYRLMDCDSVTHEALMRAHSEETRRRIALAADTPPTATPSVTPTVTPSVTPSPAPSVTPSAKPTVVLTLHDATELDYTTIKSLEHQLGQIGQGTHRGYICHNSLAVRLVPDPDEGVIPETLGLLSQILHHRPRVQKGETAKEARERISRESRLWVRGVQACGPSPQGCLSVDVSDSLSDTYEYMAHEVNTNRHFVLRARENRRLAETLPTTLPEALPEAIAEPMGQSGVASIAGVMGVAGVVAGDPAKSDLLFETLRSLKSAGSRELTVQASPERKSRTTTVQVAFAPVRIAQPGKKSGEYDNESLDVWGVRVWESNTPAPEDPLEWLLLTNCPVENLADAFERLDWYALRWIIEEYHKCMKTGCGIETLQLTSTSRVEPAIAALSAVATMLLRLRDAARAPDADTRAATEVVDPIYVEALAAFYRGRLKGQVTILKFYLHVARLGGHQNRKGDGLPGWLTLWRGWTKLESMVAGFTAARNICG